MPRETYSTQTPETLRAMAEELRRVAAQYDTVAESWNEMRIEEAAVKGESERKRSLQGASAFAQNAQAAMWDELARRQKFGVPLPGKPPKPEKG